MSECDVLLFLLLAIACIGFSHRLDTLEERIRRNTR
jgi:hypothetical protein